MRSNVWSKSVKPEQRPDARSSVFRSTNGRSLGDWVRRNSVLALLVFTCLTMCVVAFEQNRTIALQQDLIKSLFRDTIELNAMKMHAIESEARPLQQPQTQSQQQDSPQPEPTSPNSHR